MYLHMPLGTAGLGQGAGTPQAVPLPSARKNHARSGRSFQAGKLSVRRYGAPHQTSTNATVKHPASKADDPELDTDAGLGFGSVLRSVFDFSTLKVSAATASRAAATAAAATAAAVASSAARPPAAGALGVAASSVAQSTAAVAATSAATTPPPFPSGSFAVGQIITPAAAAAATGAAATTGNQPMAALAEQVLTGHGAVQEDPVAAARQLQLFLSQYKDQYGPETDARISAAVAKLQDYIQGYSQQQLQGGPDAGGLVGAAAAMAGTDGVASGGEGVVYHNYILEQLTGILDWVNNLLVNSNPKPFVFDAYGRVLENPAAVVSLERQQEQLRAASNSLRLLIKQLQQVNRQYAVMADPDEKAAMGQVLSQLTTMADRLAVAATRRPLPPQPSSSATAAAAGGVDAAADLGPYVQPAQLYGAEEYRDPLLRVLDGVYQAVVVDSGLREFLTGIKQLGDSLVASMAVAWTGAPPIGRLIAYIAAVAGVLFIMRTRLPPALLAPTKIFGHLGQGGSGGGGGGSSAAADAAASGSGPEPGAAVPPTIANPAAAAAFAAIAANSNGSSDGPATAAAAAAAFAAIAANNDSGGGGSGGGTRQFPGGPLTSMDRGGGLGDTRLSPSEILASNDLYTTRATLIETQAAPVATSGGGGGSALAAAGTASGKNEAQRSGGGGGFGSGWAALIGAAPSPAEAAASPSGSTLFNFPSFPGGGGGGGVGNSGSSGGGRASRPGDGQDWWALPGQQQAQTPTQAQPPAAVALPPPLPAGAAPSGTPPRAPSVAESWEAFRRIQDAAPTAAADGGGVLDTTAALAAAAVAAAAVGGAGATASDPKMTELARAAEERRLSKDRARLRATIKDRLRWVCLALGPVSSVVPGGEPLREEVDGLLTQLEALSPTDKPLNIVVDVARRPTVGPLVPMADPLLIGEWRLVYASNASATAGVPSAASQAASGGPNLLAQILQIADSLPGFGMTHVVQRLAMDVPASAGGGGGFAARAGIMTENSAVFRFGPLGSWRVCVRGRWVDNGGGMCAAAEFESFAVRPVDLWGLPLEELLPEVVVPVPEVLRSRSEWCTTYLDEEMRIGRGSGGALFLFRRGPGEVETAAAVAAAQPPPLPPLRVPASAGAGAAAAAAAASSSSSSIRQPVMRPL